VVCGIKGRRYLEIKLINKSTKSTTIKQNIPGLEIIGGGSVEIWKFAGIKKGTYQMHFYYKQPNQDGIRRMKNIKIIIN